ncbi:MAG: hypothetical protein ACLFTQ_00565 [Candidatus Aenigmatarchaeota archaeon]
MFAVDGVVKDMSRFQQRVAYEKCLDSGNYVGAVVLIANDNSLLREELKKPAAAKWCEQLFDERPGYQDLEEERIYTFAEGIKDVHFDSEDDYEFWKEIADRYLEMGELKDRIFSRGY